MKTSFLLFCLEEQKEQFDGIKEGTVNIMLKGMKDIYIEKRKI